MEGYRLCVPLPSHWTTPSHFVSSFLDRSLFFLQPTATFHRMHIREEWSLKCRSLQHSSIWMFPITGSWAFLTFTVPYPSWLVSAPLKERVCGQSVCWERNGGIANMRIRFRGPLLLFCSQTFHTFVHTLWKQILTRAITVLRGLLARLWACWQISVSAIRCFPCFLPYWRQPASNHFFSFLQSIC